MKSVSNKYQSGELKSLGNHKFSITLTISSVEEADAENEHYLLVRGTDAKRTEHKWAQIHLFLHAPVLKAFNGPNWILYHNLSVCRLHQLLLV